MSVAEVAVRNGLHTQQALEAYLDDTATIGKVGFCVIKKENAMKDTFIVHTSYLERFANLSDEQLGTLFRAMLEYQASGVAPQINDMAVSFCFDVVKYDMDVNNDKYEKRCQQQRENVEKRWNKQKEGVPTDTNDTMVYHGIPSNTNYTKHTDNDNDNDNDNEYDSDNDNDNDSDLKREDTIVSKREVRHRFGQYNNVLLSDSDLEKLEKEFPDDWQERIERLSEYIESKGVKYKNHLATIRAWARKNAPKKTEYDWGELDERSLG